jgi:hypothetical protein
MWQQAVMPFEGSRAEYYREAAQRLRLTAATLRTLPAIKEQFEQMARQYEMLAEEIGRGLLRN